MPYYLKHKNSVFQADDSILIALGKSESIIEVLSQDAEHNSIYRANDTQRIFVIEEMSIRFRPLLSLAKGFIFRTGNNLSHFANIIRYNHVPACISVELWNVAMGLNDEFCEFNSGDQVNYTTDEKKGYARNYIDFCSRINEQAMQMPVYDMERKRIHSAHEPFNFKIGQKALSVNMLASLGYMTPKTMILGNFNAGEAATLIDDLCVQVICRSFPGFGEGQNMPVMVRASLYSDPSASHAASGLIPSKPVKTKEELLERLSSVMERWNNIPETEGRYALSILLQELIPVKVYGLLYTCLPWARFSREYIMQFKVPSDEAESGFNIQTIIDIFPDQSTGRSQDSLSRMLKDSFTPILPPGSDAERLCAGLVHFVEDCFKLQTYLHIPLEIEFIITESGEFMFIQFRHVFKELR